MPFDESPKDFMPKQALKQMQGQKSMFDNKPKKPTQQQLEQRVEGVQEQALEYKKRAAELFIQFSKSMADPTLAEHRNVFTEASEREMLQKMVQLAMDVNGDPNEAECMGSLTLITCLFKALMAQRDKINDLSYALAALQKKSNPDYIADCVRKEITAALDKQEKRG